MKGRKPNTSRRPRQYREVVRVRKVKVRVPVERVGRLTYEEQLADNIKRFRRDRGMSQADLAHKVGLSRQSIANIESFRQAVTIERLYLLAYALDVRIAELMPPGRWETP